MTANSEMTDRATALDALRSRDLAPDIPPSQKDRSALLLQLILVLCLCLFAGSAFALGKTLYAYIRADDLYGDINESYLTVSRINPLLSPSAPYGTANVIPDFLGLFDMADTDRDNWDVPPLPVSPELLRMQRVLAALRLQNEDTYGWVSIADTKIDYPVVQADDNNYYLDHAFTGGFLEAGAIYTDYRNSAVPSENYNTILYGHNMKSGIMFHDLQDYFDGTGEFLRTHNEIVLATDSGIYTYRIFALYAADASENYIRTQFGTRPQFLNFVTGLRNRTADVYRAVTEAPDPDAPILTLSTCTNRTATTERYAIHAYLVSVEQ